MTGLLDIYFVLGIEHILDIQGVDHILFIITLAAVYSFWDWKKVLILATAFTIGHSITLALAVLEIVTVPGNVIEYAIPVTIIITGISNLIKGIEKPEDRNISNNYYYALFFGLIHGLGFSNYLKSILGGEDNVALELLYFNLGLEAGQVIIVTLFLVAGYILQRQLKIKRTDWNVGISSAAIGMSILLLLNL